MAAFASAAATAVATAQSVAEEGLRRRIEASEQERARWARELHDETLQSLGAIRVLLDSAAGRSEEARERSLERASAQLEEEIFKLNSLITELRPAALDQLGLASGIQALARRAAAAFGVEVRCDVELQHEGGQQEARLDPEVETTAYRLVQEAVNNAGKHGDPRSIEVRVKGGEKAIGIEVEDDGKGFDPDDEHDGFGLVGMRERVELVNGSIAIDSEPDRGTTLIARLPVRRAGDRTAPAAEAPAHSKAG
jgi:signal transduction histidine kinase